MKEITLFSNNPRIKDVYITDNYDYMNYEFNGQRVEVWGELSVVCDRFGYILGYNECAVVRDEDDNVIEEVPFTAYFKEEDAV